MYTSNMHTLDEVYSCSKTPKCNFRDLWCTVMLFYSGCVGFSTCMSNPICKDWLQCKFSCVCYYKGVALAQLICSAALQFVESLWLHFWFWLCVIKTSGNCCICIINFINAEVHWMTCFPLPCSVLSFHAWVRERQWEHSCKLKQMFKLK